MLGSFKAPEALEGATERQRGKAMHALHLRLPKNFVLEERLERYAGAIEVAPASYHGWWAEACAPIPSDWSEHKHASFARVRVDLGCGKGSFLVEAARRERDTLWIGIDNEPICIAYAAQAICESGLSNAIVFPGSADHICTYFEQGEISRIYLNFPTPYPKAKHAAWRLTYYNHLLDYYRVLNGYDERPLVFKTDSQPLYLWTINQLRQPNCPFHSVVYTDDMRAEFPDDPETGYERRLTAQGAKVYGFVAHPDTNCSCKLEGYESPRAQSNCPQSLCAYLPQDLRQIAYIPYGMEATVINWRNRQKKQDGRYDSSTTQ